MRNVSSRKVNLWFKSSVLGGIVLALISVAVSVSTYRFVAGHLALDHLNREAGRYAANLEYRATNQARTAAELTELLNELQHEDSDKVAWFRVLGRKGEIIAETRAEQRDLFAQQDLQKVLDLRRRNMVQRLSTENGDVLAAVLPFRFQLEREVAARAQGQNRERQRRFKLIEVALYLRGANDAFAPLKRNLVAGIAAALALLASIVFLAMRLPAYLHGRELEHQLALAHRVQQELLPNARPDSGKLLVAAEFRPFWGVGGDYFDVFTLEGSRTFLVLGDVSGKGLPAALIMGLLHGAVRSTARSWDGSNHDVLAREFNQLLFTNTASNRFVTFFWACFEPREGRLRYINAGHNPPFLVRPNPEGVAHIEQLPAGGPVLGLLPEATYQKGDTQLGPGDFLVLFSDGIVEATNAQGVEFETERFETVIRDHADASPDELKRAILDRLSKFMGSEPLQDDMTLLIVKVPPTAAS